MAGPDAVNHGALSRLRVDREMPADDFQAPLHAGQAEAGPSQRLMGIETTRTSLGTATCPKQHCGLRRFAPGPDRRSWSAPGTRKECRRHPAVRNKPVRAQL